MENQEVLSFDAYEVSCRAWAERVALRLAAIRPRDLGPPFPLSAEFGDLFEEEYRQEVHFVKALSTISTSGNLNMIPAYILPRASE